MTMRVAYSIRMPAVVSLRLSQSANWNSPLFAKAEVRKHSYFVE